MASMSRNNPIEEPIKIAKSKWLVPESQLDDQQRNFIENVDIDKQNVWIKGFPGSGKSVLLAHTLRRIKNKNENAKVAVVVFTRSLISMYRSAFAEMGMSAEIMTFYDFLGSASSYEYILSDEIQDMPERVLNAMITHANRVIVAGDENQSIYECDPKYKEPTVLPSQIEEILNCRGSEVDLRIIHRLSRSIINAIQKFMPNLNLLEGKVDMTKKSTQIRLCSSRSSEEETKYIMKEAEKAVNVGQTVAILIPNGLAAITFVNEVLKEKGEPQWNESKNQWGKPDFGNLNQHLQSHSVKLQYVGNGYGSFDNEDKICVMTYHSSKGLDFDNVFLPNLNKQLVVYKDEKLSKTLFMVAMTRSRNNLYLTYSGEMSDYLQSFSDDCNKIDIHSALLGKSSFGNSTNIFGF